jgi:hypothetical protein
VYCFVSSGPNSAINPVVIIFVILFSGYGPVLEISRYLWRVINCVPQTCAGCFKYCFVLFVPCKRWCHNEQFCLICVLRTVSGTWSVATQYWNMCNYMPFIPPFFLF